MSKGLWAITDQGLFALTNFGVNVLLARWLTQSDYGAFGIAFSVLLLMGTIHSALLTEPMLILGPSRYRESTPNYITRLVPLHFVLTSGMGVALLLGVLTLTVSRLQFRAANTLIALAFTAPAILFLWLLRRASYIESRPRLAATAGLAYAVLMSSLLLLLGKIGLLTAASGLVALGTASLLVAWWLKSRLVDSASGQTTPLTGKVVLAHWLYGRWALANGLLSWVPTNMVVLALPLWHSLADVGTLRVATTLILPILHVQGALGLLLMPTLVRSRSSGQLVPRATLARVLFSCLSITYAPLILTFGTPFAELLFGSQYRIDGITLWLLAATPLITATSMVSGAILRALERPDRVLWTYVASNAVTCLIGLPLVYYFSVDGALASILLSSATTAVLGTLASRRLIATLSSASDAREDFQRKTPPNELLDRTPAESPAYFIDSSRGGQSGGS